MKEKKLITEYFDGVLRNEKTKKVFSKTPIIKAGLKLSLAAMFSYLILLSVSSVGGTVSYFNDTEGVLNNYFRADPISFKVGAAPDQIDLSEERNIDLVMTPDEISDPIQYFVTAKVVAGDGEFCSGIYVVGSMPFNVSNKIDSLNTDISTTTGTWTITASVADGLKIPGRSCQVELTYLGWNAGSILGKSFTDIRKVDLLFFIPSTYKVYVAPVISEEKAKNTEIIIPEPTQEVEDVGEENKEEVTTESTSTQEVASPDENVPVEVTPIPTPILDSEQIPGPTNEPTPTPTPEVSVTPEIVPTPVVTVILEQTSESVPS